MKVIFLDVDGVLIHNQYKDNNKYNIDESKIKIIKKIVDQTDAKLVLTTTWRESSVESEAEYYMPEYNLLTSLLKKQDLEIYDKTPVHRYKLLSEEEYKQIKEKLNSIFDPITTRAGEIYTWIKSNEVEQFLIIDDDDSEWQYFNLEENLIKTSYDNGGINEKDIKEAIKILNKSKQRKR